MKAIILARVSTKDQEEGHSIPAQVRRLTEYTARKGLEVLHVFQLTESSNKENRKKFNQVLTLIKNSDQTLALVTDTIDRLQRSFRETPILDDLRKQGKLELHFLRENLVINKDSNGTQLTQWDMGVVFAAIYIRQISDNVKRSKEQSTKNGQWTAKAPFGYKNVILPSDKKFIEIDPDSAAFVIKMFELYGTGVHSFQTIADELNRLGMRNAMGNPIISSRVEVTLKNPFYIGKMRAKGELYPHQYTPLISEELFDRVQDIIAGHYKAPVHYAGKPILFRGLIKCGRCDCMVTGDIKKQKYTYYSCNNAKGLCTKVWVREEKLLDQIVGYLDKIRLTDRQIADIVVYLKQSYAHEQEFYNHSHATLRKEFDQVQSRISKLIDLHVDGKIDAEAYRLKLEEYKTRQREITHEMKSHVNADESCLIAAETVLGLAKRAKELFMSSKLDEKQQILNFVFSNLKLNGERLDLELKEPFSILAKLSDQPEWLPGQDSNLRPND